MNIIYGLEALQLTTQPQCFNLAQSGVHPYVVDVHNAPLRILRMTPDRLHLFKGELAILIIAFHFDMLFSF